MKSSIGSLLLLTFLGGAACAQKQRTEVIVHPKADDSVTGGPATPDQPAEHTEKEPERPAGEDSKPSAKEAAAVEAPDPTRAEGGRPEKAPSPKRATTGASDEKGASPPPRSREAASPAVDDTRTSREKEEAVRPDSVPSDAPWKLGKSTDVDGKPPPPPPGPEPKRVLPKSAGVKAGAADDNLQFGAFLSFLRANEGRVPGPDVSSRTVVSVRDKAGLPVANARLTLVNGATRMVRRTFSDGRALIFPSESGPFAQGTRLRVDYGERSKEVLVSENRRQVDVALDVARVEYEQVPLDVAFVLDTTCSMGDEIDRLKETIATIHFQITSFAPRPDVRFGMVLFRDMGDDYRTRVIPFTGDVDAFARSLQEVQAGGGGDTPEDVQEGLRMAMQQLAWRDAGARVAFLIGDAPPHFDYGETFSYVEAMRSAAERGIKIAAIGASGLDATAEVVWRRLAQYTMSPFVFLTYGESGDSEGGTPTSVSHHVGSNWVAENLDAIVVRMLKLELLQFAPRGAPKREDFFEATLPPGGRANDVLEDLFGQSAKQLVEYAVEPIDDRTPTVVLPIGAAAPKLKTAREKLEARLALGLSSQRAFQLVESRNLPEIQKLVAKQFEASYDEKRMIEVGKLVPARLAVLANLAPGSSGRLELLVKLIRLETGEVLSLSLLKLDAALLL